MPPNLRNCLLATAASFIVLSPSGASAAVDYATQIQPILDAKCADCHQPARVVDGRKYKPKAGVVLTSAEGLAEAMVIDWERPPEHSLLVQRISLPADHEDVMPPAKANNPITKAEIDLIKLYIKETAPVASTGGEDGKPVRKVGFSSVKSILSSKCYKCHNSNEKPKGGLVLDTIAGIRSSGAVIPGKPESSELLIRMELPQNDDDVMPPKKTGQKMTVAENNTVRDWILGGAPYGDVGNAPLVVKEMTGGQVMAKGIKQADIAAVQKLQEYGATITPISADSPMVVVEFISGYSEIGDDFVKQLYLIAPNIAELDLKRTKITDAALKDIGNFARLTKLNLSDTGVTDAGIAHLVNLKYLDWINLYGTKVTDECLPDIAKIRSFKTMYFTKTKVTEDGLDKLRTVFSKAKIVPRKTVRGEFD